MPVFNLHLDRHNGRGNIVWYAIITVAHTGHARVGERAVASTAPPPATRQTAHIGPDKVSDTFKAVSV